MSRIFIAPTHYKRKFRSELIDLLKAFWGKGDGFTDEQRQAVYYLSETEVEFSDSIEGCELAVLPMSWNYYHREGQLEKVQSLIREAAQAGKKVLSWTSGDFGVRIPHDDHLIVIRTSGYRSRLPDYHKGMPVFFVDPMLRFYNSNQIIIRQKSEKPVVGFCGQAQGTWGKYARDVSRTLLRNAQYHLRMSFHETQDWYPSTLRRARILKAIEKDNRLTANFIKRSHYRAGASTPEERHRTSLEFYDNMVQSDYVVCVRGGGNFSVRLYETLAMGRVPVFVNTDCLLPLEDIIRWKDHVVWVEEKEIAEIGDVILEFHQRLSPDEFQALQERNRQIWKQYLTLGAYFRTLLNAL